MTAKQKLLRLSSSWTKYDSVKVIEIIGDNDLDSYLSGSEGIDEPVLKKFLGISEYTSPIPYYWEKIQEFPQKRLFALAAAIFTHHENIAMFAEKFSTGNMQGVFKIGDGGKHMTNLRSALVVSGAAANSFRRRDEVPYDISPLFDEGEIGVFFQDLLIERLSRIGFVDSELKTEFLPICISLNFHKALGLTETQFERWINGNKISQIQEFGYELSSLLPSREIDAIRVKQWLSHWDNIDFDQELRRKPDPHFFIFSIDIRLLKRLADVHRRKANTRRIEEDNVQRSHDAKRSTEITKYVQDGFPLSTLSEKDRSNMDNHSFRMPGILPTAIVANILGPNSRRGDNYVREEDLIQISPTLGSLCKISIPESVFSTEWDPELKPLEIIDGQHRIMAFAESESINGNFEVPVVAFFNLDRTWQAYLFYVINIKPKKINTSLGYDLYPLLRTQEWLERSKDGSSVYRETRAQELVEALWVYEQSPWHDRINMLGTGSANISQAAFIGALTNSYLRKPRPGSLRGLFSDILPDKNSEEIKWVRAQQAAFLVLLWEQIALAASSSTKEWAQSLRKEQDKKQLLLFDSNQESSSNLIINDAFFSKNSMLSRDQGVTGISMLSNDIFYIAANYYDDYDFNSIEWKDEVDERQIEIRSLDIAIEQFRSSNIHALLKQFALEVMNFDWRMSSASFDSPTEGDRQKKYRGSGGYREVWRDLKIKLLYCEDEKLRKYAEKLNQLTPN